MEAQENLNRIGALLRRMAADDSLHPCAEDAPVIRELCRLMPYSPVGWLLALRTADCAGLDSADVKAHLFMTSSSESTLNYGARGEQWSNFYPAAAEPRGMATEQVIDTFLTRYATTSPEEEALLEKMIFNPTPDYGEVLAREESGNLPEPPRTEEDSDDARIASFILSHHPATHVPEPVPELPGEEQDEHAAVQKPESETEGFLGESLAAIFIRQGRYQKAFDIISSLNLKFPKKSAYFADQLRFLRKLIMNQERLESGKQNV